MGAEGKGMRRLTREQCDYLIHLPMAGSVSSLNVSVAAGIFLFEVVRQRAAGQISPCHLLANSVDFATSKFARLSKADPPCYTVILWVALTRKELIVCDITRSYSWSIRTSPNKCPV